MGVQLDTRYLEFNIVDLTSTPGIMQQVWRHHIVTFFFFIYGKMVPVEKKDYQEATWKRPFVTSGVY